MRTDTELDASLRNSGSWKHQPTGGQTKANVNRYTIPDLERGRMSFSGRERNHLFMNVEGTGFQDVSGISGVDAIEDSRAFAILDFDRDGWQDIVLTNVNAPVIRLFRNQVGSSDISPANSGNMLAFQFVGGNTDSKLSKSFGCRDGYGVKVTVTLPDKKLKREYRCGEGFAAQNTKYMQFGLGSFQLAEVVEVQWPSGITQRIENVNAGDLVTVFENVAQSPDQTGFSVQPYIVPILQQE